MLIPVDLILGLSRYPDLKKDFLSFFKHRYSKGPYTKHVSICFLLNSGVSITRNLMFHLCFMQKSLNISMFIGR